MKLVIDTNIVLDLFVFRDEGARELHEAIAARQVEWLTTAAMRAELACVLAREKLTARLAAAGLTAEAVLESFDRHACLVDAAGASAARCRDPDDQKFIDLAMAHDATLLSKDAKVLALRRKLAVSRSFATALERRAAA